MAQETVEIPKKEYEEMKATVETLKDQEVMKQIAESEKAAEEGKEKDWKEVKKKL